MMSSTSFSSYEHCKKDHSRRVLGNLNRKVLETDPPGMLYGQPLVYYNKVERPAENEKLLEFAAWLDSKYTEYLCEIKNSVHGFESHRKPIVVVKRRESYRTTETCKAKKFGRMRSPWNRLRNGNKNTNEELCKTNISCEFILQPKNVTCSTSECYNPLISFCPNKSNCTIRSVEYEMSKKSKEDSHSLTSFNRERSIQDFIEMMVGQEGPSTRGTAEKGSHCLQKCRNEEQIQQTPLQIYKQDMSCEQNQNIIQEYKRKDIQTFSKSQNTLRNQFSVTEQRNGHTTSKTLQMLSKTHNVNHECECHNESASLEKPVQYDSIKNCLCKCSMVDTSERIQLIPTVKCRCMALPKLSRKINVACQCPKVQIQLDVCTQYDRNDFDIADTSSICTKTEKSKYDSRDAKYKNTQHCAVRNLPAMEKVTRELSIFSNVDVQTSDHSINIGTGDGNQCIYFMKIICCEEFNCCR